MHRLTTSTLVALGLAVSLGGCKSLNTDLGKNVYERELEDTFSDAPAGVVGTTPSTRLTVFREHSFVSEPRPEGEILAPAPGDAPDGFVARAPESSQGLRFMREATWRLAEARANSIEGMLAARESGMSDAAISSMFPDSEDWNALYVQTMSMSHDAVLAELDAGSRSEEARAAVRHAELETERHMASLEADVQREQMRLNHDEDVAQAKYELEAKQVEAKLQLEAAKLHAQTELAEEQLEAQMQLEAAKIHAKAELAQEELGVKMQLEMLGMELERAQMEFELAIREMELEQESHEAEAGGYFFDFDEQGQWTGSWDEGLVAASPLPNEVCEISDCDAEATCEASCEEECGELEWGGCEPIVCDEEYDTDCWVEVEAECGDACEEPCESDCITDCSIEVAYDCDVVIEDACEVECKIEILDTCEDACHEEIQCDVEILDSCEIEDACEIQCDVEVLDSCETEDACESSCEQPCDSASACEGDTWAGNWNEAEAVEELSALGYVDMDDYESGEVQVWIEKVETEDGEVWIEVVATTDSSSCDSAAPKCNEALPFPATCEVVESDCGPSDCGPSDCGPSDCGPSDCGPSDCGPSDCGPSDCGPSDCDEAQSDGGKSDCSPAKSSSDKWPYLPTDACPSDKTESCAPKSDCGPSECDDAKSDCGPGDCGDAKSDCGPADCGPAKSDCAPTDCDEPKADCAPADCGTMSDCGDCSDCGDACGAPAAAPVPCVATDIQLPTPEQWITLTPSGGQASTVVAASLAPVPAPELPPVLVDLAPEPRELFGDTPVMFPRTAAWKVNYSNAELAGETIELTVTSLDQPEKKGGPDALTATYELTLNKKGKGKLKARLPEGWRLVRLDGPDAKPLFAVRL